MPKDLTIVIKDLIKVHVALITYFILRPNMINLYF